MVLDLTLRRLRQITTAIRLRQEVRAKRDRRLVAWHARSVARFIAMSVPLGEGEKNPLFPLLTTVVLDDEERAELEYAMNVTAAKPATETAVEQNSSGTFEKLMGGFRQKGGLVGG